MVDQLYEAHTNSEIEKSVIRSQHTQRNFNLNKKKVLLVMNQ